jgi:hypothetical protein
MLNCARSLASKSISRPCTILIGERPCYAPTPKKGSRLRPKMRKTMGENFAHLGLFSANHQNAPANAWQRAAKTVAEFATNSDGAGKTLNSGESSYQNVSA